MSESVERIQHKGSPSYAIHDNELYYFLGNDEVCSFVGSDVSWTRCMMNRRTFSSRYRAVAKLAKIVAEREMTAI